MSLVLVSLIGGIALGATIALVALGIVLAFRATGTFNFAHGEFMLLPALIVGMWQANHTGSLVLSVALGLTLIAVIAVGFYLIVLQRVSGGLHNFLGVIATLGLASVLDGVILFYFGSPSYSITFSFLPTGVVTIAGARVSSASLVLTAFSLCLAAVVAGTLRFTQLGRRVRAAGQNAILASHSGINVRRIQMGSWAVAAGLAGIAGIAYGSTTIVDTTLEDVALVAFPAIIIGGLDSIEGAVIGGILVGILQGFVTTYLNPNLVYVITYAVLLVVMLLYPQGLWGTKHVARV